jgi:hypothetical protein
MRDSTASVIACARARISSSTPSRPTTPGRSLPPMSMVEMSASTPSVARWNNTVTSRVIEAPAAGSP